MKIKFEVKKIPTGIPIYTLFMENQLESVKFIITQHKTRNMTLTESSHSALPQDVPIENGELMMDKAHLKKFIEALKCLLKG